MTRRLLLALAEMHASPATKVFLALVLVAVLPFSLLADALTFLARRRLLDSVLGSAETTCPGGHRVELLGSWVCAECRLAYDGHGFLCAQCGAFPAAVHCACGRTVRSPLWEPA